LEDEHDNLRAAMNWALKQDGNEAERHMELALRLGGALRRFWQMHGHLEEGQLFLARALAASEGSWQGWPSLYVRDWRSIELAGSHRGHTA
jgi:hypothetical protein